jgi:predicted transcriptional regulator
MSNNEIVEWAKFFVEGKTTIIKLQGEKDELVRQLRDLKIEMNSLKEMKDSQVTNLSKGLQSALDQIEEFDKQITTLKIKNNNLNKRINDIEMSKLPDWKNLEG